MHSEVGRGVVDRRVRHPLHVARRRLLRVLGLGASRRTPGIALGGYPSRRASAPAAVDSAGADGVPGRETALSPSDREPGFALLRNPRSPRRESFI